MPHQSVLVLIDTQDDLVERVAEVVRKRRLPFRIARADRETGRGSVPALELARALRVLEPSLRLLVVTEEKGDASSNGLTLSAAQQEHIRRVLEDCGGNISEAARRLGLHRRSLQRKLRRPA